MKQDNTENNKKRSNRTLWIMVLLFGLPYLAAFYFYFNRDVIELPTSNYGTIVNPARPILDVRLKKLDGSSMQTAALKGKWVLMTIASSRCQADCVDNLYKIRQIKKAVGQDFKRIRKVLILQDKVQLAHIEKLLVTYPGMDVFIPGSGNHQKFIDSFAYKDKPLQDSVFIIDPLGNYMMIYEKGADARKMLKDIERLLKVSKIG